MSIKFAFSGFRHAHIFSMYSLVKTRKDIDITACCEDHQDTIDNSLKGKNIQVTHAHLGEALEHTACDVVAIGDYYTRRGALAIQALEAGKHVIADKPICTSLKELDKIEELTRRRGLKFGCMLDMRDTAVFIGARQMILAGEIGEVHGIQVGGQHPLSLGSRPGWYFEPGKHGGTINDIGIHALDFIPWATGLEFTEINAARSWNAFAGDFPHFKDAGQVLMTMNNGCGVLGDFSYFTPDSAGYSLPFYWRTTFWGRKGIIEVSCTAPKITLALNGEKGIRQVDPPAKTSGKYLQCFLDEINGRLAPDDLSTAAVLKAARVALLAQQAGDEKLTNVKI